MFIKNFSGQNLVVSVSKKPNHLFFISFRFSLRPEHLEKGRLSNVGNLAFNIYTVVFFFYITAEKMKVYWEINKWEKLENLLGVNKQQPYLVIQKEHFIHAHHNGWLMKSAHSSTEGERHFGTGKIRLSCWFERHYLRLHSSELSRDIISWRDVCSCNLWTTYRLHGWCLELMLTDLSYCI